MVSTATASFDPTAFQLPDNLKQVQGPAVQAPPVKQEVRFVEQQLALERAQTQPHALIEQNLQRQVKQVREQARCEQLKQILLSLRGMRLAEPATANFSQSLMQAIEALKACFADNAVAGDLETMGLLFPLLKCQDHKWEQLNSGQFAEPPALESKLLQKWRSLKGGLSAVEKATVYQIIEGLNFLIARLKTVSAQDEVTVTLQAKESQAKDSKQISETEAFDPMTCGRKLLQLRAKIQRSCAESEKQILQAQLSVLLEQQNAYYAQRRSQSLIQHQKKYSQICEFVNSTLSSAQLQQLRQELIQQLEQLQRLFAQNKEQPLGPDIFVSASRQLARLGMDDAEQVIAQEQAQQSVWIQAFAEAQQRELKSWQMGFMQVLNALEQTLSRIKQSTKKSQSAALTAQIQAAQTQFQSQRQSLIQWEQAWKETKDPVQQSELRQKILLAYSQLILNLPEPPVYT